MAILPILMPPIPIEPFARIAVTRRESGMSLQGMFSEIYSKKQTTQLYY
jgi:hypothetical protein